MTGTPRIDPERRRADRSAEALLLLVVSVWALNAPVVKVGLSLLDPFVFNAVRYVVAVGILALLLHSRMSWTPVAARDRGRFLRLGLLASVVYQVVFIVALSLTTAANAAILMSTSPLWTAVISARLHHETIRFTTYFALIISLCGVVLIVIGSGTNIAFGDAAVWGDLLALLSAVLWAMYTLLQKPLLADYPPTQVTTILTGIGAVGLSLIAIPFAVQVNWPSISPLAWGIAVLSGILSIGIANVLWARGIKRLGPRRTASFSNLVPVLTFILAVTLFHEPVSTLQMGGAALTVLGVWKARQ